MFKPTYLYIKQHRVSGLMYLGITARDVEKYKGSGKLWLRHIKKYGKDEIDTIWYMLFLDQQSLSEFALMQSTIMNVVESAEFANLKHELGIDGGTTSHSIETRVRMSKTRKGVKHSDMHTLAIKKTKEKNTDKIHNQFTKAKELGIEIPVVTEITKEKIKKALTGKLHSEERKENISVSIKNKWLGIAISICPHCDKEGRGPNMARYHFNNCKKNLMTP